jgi:hypothetical protein
MSKIRFAIALVAAAIVAAMPAGAAASTSTTSENWAGYVVRAKNDKRFSRVTGEWTQPAVTCANSGQTEYSAYWLGLGGDDENSDALEQIGTEANCSASGSVSYYAWYELVPSAPVKIDLTIGAGDVLAARVAVSGDKVTLVMIDRTTGRRFLKTLRMASTRPDTETAEWVTEAPSECADSTLSNCATLPLADFGTVIFREAHASAGGYTGSIASTRFRRVAITLESSATSSFGGGPGGNFGGGPGGGLGAGGGQANPTDISSSTAAATPSALSADGTAFSITYATTSAGDGPVGT